MHFDPAFFVTFPMFVFSVAAHECAHGWAALACGDTTARDQGRLTLNPIPHVDGLGSVALPALLVLSHAPFVVGWAKPVPVDRGRLRDPRNDPVRVALAGPLANLVLALSCAGVLRVAPSSGFLAPLREMLYAGVSWNCALGLFNLIPLPPLDGSWALMRFLRLRHIILLHRLRVPGWALVVVLLAWPPAAGAIANGPLRLAVHGCLAVFGTPHAGLAP